MLGYMVATAASSAVNWTHIEETIFCFSLVLEHKDSVLSCRKMTSTFISRAERTMI